MKAAVKPQKIDMNIYASGVEKYPFVSLFKIMYILPNIFPTQLISERLRQALCDFDIYLLPETYGQL